MESTKFKANPYNFSNQLITTSDIIDILHKVDINNYTPKQIHFYQKAFIHKSYNHLEDYKEYAQPEGCLPLQEHSYETLEFLGDSLLGAPHCRQQVRQRRRQMQVVMIEMFILRGGE